MQKSLSDYLWGNSAKQSYLVVAAVLVLFTMLGARELWTQEHRWADIVAGMFYRHDFLHPYLGNQNYYDKPLLSYWFIAFFSLVTGKISLWTLRLASALSGLLALYSIFRIGSQLRNKNLGLLSAWLLLTCFYFIFWARTSSADMLNLGGTLFAISWYMDHREQPHFQDEVIFFLILAFFALCKGLVAPVVAGIAIVVDLSLRKTWFKYLRLRFFVSMIPAVVLYVLPFWASHHFGGQNYNESGLYLVYRENILRYFAPFDHKDPFYTYFVYLPLYLIPWTLFFIPALVSIKSRYQKMDINSKWIVWSLFAVFLFFTLSGSRRSYYVLPIVPFAILLTSDWLLQKDKLQKMLGNIAIAFYSVFFLYFAILQPLYYSQGGIAYFAKELPKKVPGLYDADTKVVLLDAQSKLYFYLNLPATVKNYDSAELTDPAKILKREGVLNPGNNIVIITKKLHASSLQAYLPHYKKIESPPIFGEKLLGNKDQDAPVAFVPI